MPEDLKKALIVLFYIYLISAIINIISSYFDFKQGLNEEHYEKYIQKFKNNISIALFPGINILCAGAVIIGIVFFYYDKILII
jgi:1,4-dihydroxy-2-naphthoate octaprenyltransferase